MKKKIKQSTRSENKEGTINMAIITKLLDCVKTIADLSKTVIESADSEKYAKSVETLNHGVDDTFAEMRAVIMNSTKFSEEEKLERLQELARSEQEAKQKCDEAIKGNRDHVAKIAKDVMMGLMTCGLSFVPEMVKKIKAEPAEKPEALAYVDDNLLLSGGIETTAECESK